ncbi:MAG TPA: AraC family transcriptional regulator [Cyanobacteria bacterium UBA8553]|nr:AraC family transcriptional regulator [Cyanobacteria bacterium UBA8553]HAJ63225.1 AraC family transcriptional regulator [Cyanobacteria bacterium UBA8543]
MRKSKPVTADPSKTINIWDNLPDFPVLSSKPKAWSGILVEYYHHLANELTSPVLSQHLITLNFGQPYNLVQRLDGRIYQAQVPKGSIILTPAGQPGEWIWDNEVDVVHLCLEPEFVAKVATEAVEGGSTQIEILNSFATPDPQIQQIGQLLVAELESEKLGNRLYAESLANVLAVHLLRNYGTVKQTVQHYSGGLSQLRLKRAVEYIQEHLEQDISIEAIAAELDMSSYHFARLFKQSTGLAPHQYLIKCRVERAKELLLQGEMAIAEIATQVGFYDQSHLNRHFKRIVGVSPKIIQQNSKNVLWISSNVQDCPA